jgi:hypothetical protein
LWFALCDMHTPKLNTPPDAARVPCSHGRDGPLSNPARLFALQLTAVRCSQGYHACRRQQTRHAPHTPTGLAAKRLSNSFGRPQQPTKTHSHCHNLAPFCPNVRARTPFSVPHSFTSAIVERSARLVKLGAVSRGRGGPRTCDRTHAACNQQAIDWFAISNEYRHTINHQHCSTLPPSCARLGDVAVRSAGSEDGQRDAGQLAHESLLAAASWMRVRARGE